MKYVLSIIEQGSGAALSFALSLWLIRGNGAAAYGVYIFWFSTALVTSSLQNALTIAHLFPLPPGPAGAPLRRSTEELLLHVTIVLVAIYAGVTAVAVLTMLEFGDVLAEPAAIGFVPAYLLWQYARAVAFTRGDVITPVVQAGVIMLLTLSGAAFGWWQGWQPTANHALVYTGVAYTVVGVGGLTLLSRGQRLDFNRSRLTEYRGLLGVSRWAFLGALSVEVSSRLYNFLVATWFGPAALGLMSATQVMLRPATLLTGAWTSVGRAEMSDAVSRGDRQGFLRGLLRGSASAGMITLVWGSIISLGWSQVDHFLYQDRFPGAGTVALLWTVQLTLTSGVLTVGVAMQALAAFRPLALAELTGAVVAGVAMTVFASQWGANWCLIGMMLGSIVQIVAMLRVLPRELQFALKRWMHLAP